MSEFANVEFVGIAAAHCRMSKSIETKFQRNRKFSFVVCQSVCKCVHIFNRIKFHQLIMHL